MTKSQAIIRLLIIDRDVTKRPKDYNEAKKALKVLDLENNQQILECMGFDFLIEREK